MIYPVEDEELTGPPTRMPPSGLIAPQFCRKAIHKPCLTGILESILYAKQAGNPWAETAIAEISILSGVNYCFIYNVAFDRITYDIGIAT